MDDAVKKLTDVIKYRVDAFKNYDSSQKTVVMGMIALVVSMLILVSLWANKVNYRPLYSNLSTTDASKITKLLKEDKINYKLEDGGQTILVPEEQIYQLRLELAEKGLPKNGELGFELFDKSDFQSSEFSENIKYIRALQGELSQTISHLEAVEECRVNLSIPKRQIYLDEESSPTASVVLKLRGDQKLSDEEIRGIANLVASSVESMKPESVTIMTTDGKLLSDFIQQSNYGLTNYQLKIQKQIQKQTEANIKSLLDSVVGPGKAVVNAHVEIRMDQKAVQKELYQPTSENVGVVRSSKTIMEDYDNGKGAAGGANSASGDTASSTASSAAGGMKDNPVYKQKSATVNYEVSKIVESETINPGQVSRMSVGVLIDSSANLDANQLKDLKAVIASISGIDQNRGDILTVKTLKFNTEKAPEEGAKSTDIAPLLKKYLPIAIPAFAPLLILIIVMMNLKGAKSAGGKGPVKSASQTTDMVSSPTVASKPDSIYKTEEIELTGAPKNSQALDDLQQTVKSFAKKNPKMVADAFEKWLAQGE